jgi:hypothetical protein
MRVPGDAPSVAPVNVYKIFGVIGGVCDRLTCDGSNSKIVPQVTGLLFESRQQGAAI